MSESMERAHEIQEHGTHGDPFSRNVAVLVAVLAAVLAMTEIGGKGAQNQYLTHHIAVSDDYAFYQAKLLRATVRSSEITILSSLPNAADPAIQARLKEAEEFTERMRDDPEGGGGMKQLMVKAREQEEARDHEEHRYHGFEYAAGGLEIAIVLSSVAVVTHMKPLAMISACIGFVAGLASLAVASGVF